MTKICFENALLAYLTGNCQCGTNFFRTPSMKLKRRGDPFLAEAYDDEEEKF